MSSNNLNHFTIYVFGSVTNIIVSYFILFYITQHLSKANYAEYGFFYSVFSLCLIIFNFGAKESFFKLKSKNQLTQLRRITNWYLGWQLIICAVVLFLSLFDARLALMLSSFVVLAWFLAANAFNRGAGLYLLDAIALPLQRTLWFAVLAVLILMLPDINHVHVFLAGGIASLVALLLIGRHAFTFGRLLPSFSPPPLMFKFMVIEISIVTYTKVDMLLLKGFNTEIVKVADYFFALQIFDVAIMLLTPISYFFFNHLAKQLQQPESVAGASLIKYIVCLLLMVMGGHFLWHLIGALGLSLLFPDYQSSFTFVSHFLWVLYPVVIILILSSYLIMFDLEKQYAGACVLALVCYLIAGFVFIPEQGVFGAIFSRLVTEIVLLITLFILVLKQRKTECRMS